ncbi:1-deoxy-D-xylulose-5-phosphate reductoisomerase [Jatrophihabitans sp.]|uniref:1-deoxy-D-xylulose-5-phosphate reductoisomerase n=1 Tax=Jatrophihabitans sp. TaxID=1932789 RepID=UPI0030C780B6|nr:1-deoxy-D-xylulose 5-phosphate reductoisomerase [Jatrophihabitans sp.]
MTPRRIVLLGSTGSIGTQAIDVVRAAPERFTVSGIAAGGADPSLLAAQAAELRVGTVAISRAEGADQLRDELRWRWPADAPAPRVLAGPGAVAELAAQPCDMVLNGVAGAQGLRATVAALQAGNVVGLANKESLVAGGPLVTRLAGPGQLVAVDSEHSALAQCLRSGSAGEVAKLVITASGGPFRGRSRESLTDATPAQALAHPTWNMGQLVTTNSATLVNKGLEMIEAHLLFDIPYDRIEVVVHPQSIVHSMVEFTDGSTIAQASPPDMRLPIALAMGWPDRVPGAAKPVDWTKAASWTFEPLDEVAFPAVALARTVGEAGGCAPAVYNAANEELVAAFHAGHIGFLAIVDTLELVVGEWLSDRHASVGNPGTVEDVEQADAWARARARRLAL